MDESNVILSGGKEKIPEHLKYDSFLIKLKQIKIKKDYSCDRIIAPTENEQGDTYGVRRNGRGKQKGRCFVHQVHP